MKKLLPGLLLCISWPVFAQTANLADGENVFREFCTRCHIPFELRTRFNNDWLGYPASDLLQRVKTTMPGEAAGTLSDQQYLDVTAFVLNLGGVATGQNPTMASLTNLSIVPVSQDSEAATPETPWAHFNGNSGSTRYSSLEQINAENFADLEISWRWNTTNIGPSPEGVSVTSPLMVNGVLYATAGTTRNVAALDAETGQLLWLWRPQEGERFDAAPRKGSGKSLSYWSDGVREAIFTVTPGYYLVALNAHTGLPVEDFGAGGWVDLQQGLRLGPGREDLDIGLSFPPLVVDNVVVVGASHAVSMRPPSSANVKGDIRGYDAISGELLWTFHTIPEPDEFGAETWLGNSAEYTGNAGVWSHMSADPELGLVYLPIETPTGDVYGGDRPGDNLFANTLVALDYRTGEVAWYNQLIHHDIWDWDNPAAPLLTDMPDGRKLIVQLTKQGIAYVFDRVTGEPVWDMVERPVPQSDVPGESTSLTQPFPTKPPPFVRHGMSVDELIDFTPELRQKAEALLSQYRYGPIFTPASLADDPSGTKGTMHLPSVIGGANWPGGAYDPETGILYATSREMVSLMSLVPGGDASSVTYISGGGSTTVDGLPLIKPPWGRITAIDLNTGEESWWVPNADTPDNVLNHPSLAGVELPRTGISSPVGILLTKSLLISGEGNAGRPILRAHDKASGDILAEITLPGTQTGMPMTFMLDNKQYLVLTVSGGGQSEIIALTLPD
jgi:glucose dehydrogenase